MNRLPSDFVNWLKQFAPKKTVQQASRDEQQEWKKAWLERFKANGGKIIGEDV